MKRLIERFENELTLYVYYLDTGRLPKNTYLPYNESAGQRSSVVEQRFRKPLVVGSNPIAGLL
jgi:hypothetical protein